MRAEPPGVTTGWWRGVGPTHNVFVVESFVDELAAAAKRDPVAFRGAMLQHNPRALGQVQQSNFHDYRAMRINEAPRIEVFQIRNNESPGGIGETGTVAAAPSLDNATFAATGRRLRRLPFQGQLEAS